MRVLALTNLYPNPLQPHRAPFNRHQFRLLNAIVPVRVVSPVSFTDELAFRRAGRKLPRQTELDGLQVDHPRYIFTPRLLRGQYGRFFLWSVGRTVRRVAATFHPTILLAPWAYPDGWAAVKLGRQLGLPVVVQVHGSDVKLLSRNPSRRVGTVEALKRADGVIAVSQDLASDILAFGAEPQRVRVIYDGVDGELFHPGDRVAARQRLGWDTDSHVILFVGNLIKTKGIDLLMRAVARLNAERRVVRVVIVGAGPERAKLESLAKSLTITEQVLFTGSVAQHLLPDYYRAADVVTLPSYSEGVPNVLLEAGACGTPWVATAVGGIPEITGRGAAMLVPPGDVDALTRALAATLDLPAPGSVAPPKSRHDAVAELHAFLLESSARP